MSQTTTPSGADVDLMAVFADCISKLEYHYRDTRAGAEMTQARTAVAALIAERDSQKDRIRSVCQMIVAEIGAGCPCNLEDAAAKLIARNAELEAERDAMAAHLSGSDAHRKARELLAAEYDREELTFVADCIRTDAFLARNEDRAIRAIVAALARTPAKGNDDA